MESEIFELRRGSELLGTVEVQDDLCDFPWYGGQFKATAAFGAVESLFRSELRLLGADDMDAWDEVWRQIDAPGLRLLPIDGGAEICDLIIHIEGEVARWRY